MNKKITFFIFFLFFSVAFANAQLAMGKWRTHFAYNNVNQLAQSQNKIFAVSDGALFSIDKRDGNVEFYSKVSGLNGNNITKIGFDDVSKNLLIIYANGNIDFMSENGIKNLPDFYNKQMSADKGVNHILFQGKKAYLSCNFGIVTLNMTKQEIQDTYYIGANASEVKVVATAVFKEDIYAATSSDIYTAPLNDPYLISYEHWTKLTNLPGSGDIQLLVSFGDNLILMRNGNLYRKGENNTWLNVDLNNNYTNIVQSGDYLLAYTLTDTYIFDKNLIKNTAVGVGTSYDGTYDITSGVFWFAQGFSGITKYSTIQGVIETSIKPDGPAVNIPYRLFFGGQKLFVVPGGRWSTQNKTPGMVMIFENNSWKNILSSSITPKIGDIYKVLDFMTVAVDPLDNKHFLVSSYGAGIFEFKIDEFSQWYNFTNSAIETVYDGEPYEYMRMDAGVYDSEGNVWFSNTAASKQIKVLKSDGNWAGLRYPVFDAKYTLSEILISNQNKNQKWIYCARAGAGIGIFDDNGTIDDVSDDESIFLSSFKDPDGGENIAPDNYFSLAQDHNGVIWAGTNQGPILFNNPNNAFKSGFTCTRVKIPRNDGTNLADYLLESDKVNAIAIDGANRKWLGTEASGVYLMSENGQETIKHFTSENSPLLSNNILSIAINPITGEVFIGTSNGLVSYQSDAADGTGSFNNVHVYPNPVRENFTGIITITGLTDKTNVKITDLAGNLVCQTVSNGSIATWDGKNAYGKKVSTGVYLAICVSEDGQESTTAKVLIIN
ncbi:MAG: two-component regulator propeller domain-containing protein [Paludibacteraceae bacterium]